MPVHEVVDVEAQAGRLSITRFITSVSWITISFKPSYRLGSVGRVNIGVSSGARGSKDFSSSDLSSFSFSGIFDSKKEDNLLSAEAHLPQAMERFTLFTCQGVRGGGCCCIQEEKMGRGGGFKISPSSELLSDSMRIGEVDEVLDEEKDEDEEEEEAEEQEEEDEEEGEGERHGRAVVFEG